ncbi:uncharacterized membrane protein YgaE (UPF0421/DUF939 family) [Bradyrhizobium japonicum]
MVAINGAFAIALALLLAVIAFLFSEETHLVIGFLITLARPIRESAAFGPD